MSISSSQLGDFARAINNHPAREAIADRINKRLYIKWLTANDDERKVIGDIHAAGELFYKELNIILAEIKDLETNK